MKEEKKRHYNSNETKQCLIQAAIDLFSKTGYDATTTKEIAKKAGVNESLIKRYFEGKVGLFNTVVEACKSKLMADLPYPPTESVEEELQAFFKFRMDLVKKEKKVYRVIFLRGLLDKQCALHMQNVNQNGVPHLVDRLALFQKKGQIATDADLPRISIITMGIAFSLGVWTHLLGKYDEASATAIADLASKIVSKGIRP